MVNYIC